MTVEDDRVAFAAHAAEQARALGRDEEAFRRATATLLDLDRYDYSYLWTWMGLPIIQMPADVMATQEIIWQTKPEVIIETGVARGGSVIFMASMLQLLGEDGFVLGVDIDIRAHNRRAIEEHFLAPRIKLVEGSSIDASVVSEVRRLIPEGANVMVVLDSDHSRAHVLAELRAYGPMVTKGCYMVVADTVVGHFSEAETPKKRSQVLFAGDEPLSARNDYLAETDRFEIDKTLNGKLVMSSSPGGYLRCIKH